MDQCKTQKEGNVIIYNGLWVGAKQDIPIIIFVLITYTLLTCIQSKYLVYFYFFYVLSHPLICFINICCIILHQLTYIKGIITEPGVVKKSDQESDTLITTENSSSKAELFFQERQCLTCKVIRPPKASHCYMCGNCVKSYDHHCNFMGNCIGSRNYKFFIGWLLSMLLQGSVWYIVIIPEFLRTFNYQFIKSQLENNLGMQIGFYGFIFTLLINTYCLRRNTLFIGMMLNLCCVMIIMIETYDSSLPFTQNMTCSLIFLCVTLFAILPTIAMWIRCCYQISIGVHHKEKVVLERMDNVAVFRWKQLFTNLMDILTSKIEESELYK